MTRPPPPCPLALTILGLLALWAATRLGLVYAREAQIDICTLTIDTDARCHVMTRKVRQ